jgi:serine/threonine protein phosphatase PrpC
MGEIRRPQDSNIDAWGLTHPGKVRPDNQDHFFLGTLSRGIRVEGTSIDEDGRRMLHVERLGSLAMVADGVGGRAGGEEAARLAVQDLVSSVSRSFHDADYAEAEDSEVFSPLLHEAALACHESLLKKAEHEGDGRSFSTTITLYLGLWPHAYLLQVGDSRCYIYQDGALTQISRDQTWAQDLIDDGTLTQTTAQSSKWANVLSSAIGSKEAAPVVTRFVREWGAVLLFCTDGLTKHVSDERIEQRLASMESARETGELLLQDALDGGGTDNITLIVGRTLRPEGA